MFTVDTPLVNESTIRVINTEAEAIEACAEIIRSTADLWASTSRSVIAFDAEWSPFGADKRVALIQTCHRTADDEYVSYLFRINRIGSVPRALIDLINNSGVVKLGVNIMGDMFKLQRDYPVDISSSYSNPSSVSVVDLGALHNALRNRQTAKWSLAGLLQNVLHKTIPKSSTESARLSDWCTPSTLSAEQCVYAALDVYATILIFERLADKLRAKEGDIDLSKLT